MSSSGQSKAPDRKRDHPGTFQAHLNNEHFREPQVIFTGPSGFAGLTLPVLRVNLLLPGKNVAGNAPLPIQESFDAEIPCPRIPGSFPILMADRS